MLTANITSTNLPLSAINFVQTALNIPHLPLLTYPQEVRYIERIQLMVKLIVIKQALANKLQRKPTKLEWATAANLSCEQLWQALRRGRTAKRRLIQAHMHLVVEIAKHHCNSKVELADLIRAGKQGLELGLVKFKPTSSGSHFIIYARSWIERNICLFILKKFLQQHPELASE